MRNLVEHILNKKYDVANQIFESEIETVTRIKLNEAKKMVAARMAEQVPAFMGAPGSNAVKLRRGVLEMDLTKEKPSSDIEDRRGTKDPNWFMKNNPVYPNAHGAPKPKNTQTVNTAEKGDLKEDTEELDEARIQILKARVRGGKVQRRKKISNVEGFKLQDGKLKRMSPAERRRRKLGQKRGKLKRKAKMRQALMKRKRSLKRRAAIGL